MVGEWLYTLIVDAQGEVKRKEVQTPKKIKPISWGLARTQLMIVHVVDVQGKEKSWSSRKRKHWVLKQRGFLLKEKTDDVIQAVQKFVNAGTVRL